MFGVNIGNPIFSFVFPTFSSLSKGILKTGGPKRRKKRAHPEASSEDYSWEQIKGLFRILRGTFVGQELPTSHEWFMSEGCREVSLGRQDEGKYGSCYFPGTK